MFIGIVTGIGVTEVTVAALKFTVDVCFVLGGAEIVAVKAAAMMVTVAVGAAQTIIVCQVTAIVLLQYSSLSSIVKRCAQYDSI